jgi:thiamine-phosphate pyrophosphorylase
MVHLPRLYAIADTTTYDRRNLDPLLAVEAMLEGGARLIQFRHKGDYTRAIYTTAQNIASLCEQAGATFVIDDRADIAKLLNAGVHVGQNDLHPNDVRAVIGGEALVGYSTHNAMQLTEADATPASYLAIGPVFRTESKENPDPVIGVEGLLALRTLTRKPLVAIGGITRENARQVIAAGIDSIAIISDLMPEDGVLSSIRSRVEEWMGILQGMV